MGQPTPRDQRRDDSAQQPFLHSRKYARVNREPGSRPVHHDGEAEDHEHEPAVTNPERANGIDAQRVPELDVTARYRFGGGRGRGAGPAGRLRQRRRQRRHGPTRDCGAGCQRTADAGRRGGPRHHRRRRRLRATSDEWEGDFGFVTLRLRKGAVDGNDVYFIRTDASDVEFAREQGLVYVPKLKVLAQNGLAGTAVLFDDDEQPVVLSSEPGRKDTPAWRVQRARWVEDARLLGSLADVEAAEQEGALTLENTDISSTPRW
jgi:hypothetical protein